MKQKKGYANVVLCRTCGHIVILGEISFNETAVIRLEGPGILPVQCPAGHMHDYLASEFKWTALAVPMQ